MIQSVFLFATFVTGDWETADSHIVISSACEKSLSFTGKRVMRETRKRETCYPKAFGHRHDLYSAVLLIFMHRTTISHFSFLISHLIEAFIHNHGTARPTDYP